MKNDRQFVIVTVLIALWVCLGANSPAAPGNVDLSFDPGSRVNDFVYAMAHQPDGKIIIGGLFTSPRTLIARLNANGSVDTNFNVGTGANGIVYSMALQPDGKIVIGGAFTRINGVSRNRIARLNVDGSLDVTFDPGLGADDRVRSVALQSNGKVVIGGDFFEVNQFGRLRIARLNANGSVDTTFDPGTGADEEVFSVVPQPDGRVLIGGYFLNVNDVPRNYIARLNSNGSVDDSFDPGAGPDLDVDSIALQSDGKVVIGGGFAMVNGFIRGCVARLHPDGSVDESFDPGLGADFHVGTVVIQTDGKVIATGNFGSFNGVPRNNVVRLNTDGAVDSSFDPGNGADGGVYAAAIQSGKVTLGGAFKLVNGFARNYIVRLSAAGAVDAGFNANTGADYPVSAIAQDAAGKVFVGGYFSEINSLPRAHVARLEANGHVDLTFEPGLGANNRVLCILPQPDGKALIGGIFTSFNGTNRSRIARLNADGQLDLNFNGGSGPNGDVLAIAQQEDGKVVIVGEFSAVDGTDRGRVARLTSAGTVDLDFNTSIGANGTVTSVAAQSDGKVIVGGDFTLINGTNRNRIARLNSDGTVDPAFNSTNGANGRVECLVVQPDGKVIIGGQFTSVNGISRARMARLNGNGSLDLGFNPGADGIVLSVALHSDGKVLMGGDFFSVSGVSRPHIARLNASGGLDTFFNPGVGANDTVSALAFQRDGKALASGFFNMMNGVGRSFLARLEGDLPRPQLTVTRSGNSVLISWPVTFTNFTLERSADSHAVQWNTSSIPAALIGAQWVVTNSLVLGSEFFRLRSF